MKEILENIFITDDQLKGNESDIQTKILKVYDFMTAGHGQRMEHLSCSLAKTTGLIERQIREVALFARLHDIGKVGIPKKILFKPGKLSEDEMDEMKLHTQIGYLIAQSFSNIKHISDWILKHHEWWDGNGYPLKLKETEIPIECRIVAIVDAYDAMTNDRPYRKALLKEEAIEEIIRFRGSQFDPVLVDKFIRMMVMDELKQNP